MRPKVPLVLSIVILILVVLAGAVFAASPTSDLLQITNEILNRIFGQITNTNAILLNQLETTNSLLADQLQVEQISTGTFVRNACEVTSVKLSAKTGEERGSCEIENYGKACKKAKEALQTACNDNCKLYEKTGGDFACLGIISDVSVSEFDKNKHCAAPPNDGPVTCEATARCSCDP